LELERAVLTRQSGNRPKLERITGQVCGRLTTKKTSFQVHMVKPENVLKPGTGGYFNIFIFYFDFSKPRTRGY
jgi:hypothetical protein